MSNQNIQTTKESEELKKRQDNLKGMLIKALPVIAETSGNLLNPERLVRITLQATSRNQKLLECSPMSILSALLQAAQMGLEPMTPFQHAYLIPRRNKWTKVMEATFEPSYRGLIAVATRAGGVAKIWSRLHYENDQFHMQYGTDERMDHVPQLEEDKRGSLAGVYCICVMKDKDIQFEYMSVNDVEKVRSRSQSGDDGPWSSDYEEMCKKTPLKRLLKRIPIDNERLAMAIQAANAGEHEGSAMATDNVIPILADIQPGPQVSKGDKLAQQLTSKKKDKGTEAKGEEQQANDGPPAPMSDEEKAQIIAEEKKNADK